MPQETSDGIPVADGFDFPVGPRGAKIDVFKTHKIDTVLNDDDYYKTLKYWHPGEDWNGRGGGDTDLGDPIYSIAAGKVVGSGHYPVWGNIVLIEHALPDNSQVWSQYAHLDKIMVSQVGQKVSRGQQIGTMGKGDNNKYLAHLHFEIRKNKLAINNWSPMVKDKNAVTANYYDPTQFIKANRQLVASGATISAPQPVLQTAQAGSQANLANQQVVLNTQTNSGQNGTFQKANVDNWFSAAGGYQGNMVWTYASSQQETNWAEWRPSLSEATSWHVWVYIPGQNATTTYARYKVVHLDGQTEVPVNQAGNSNKWVDLGAYRFGPGQGYLRLTDLTGELNQGTPAKVAFDTACWTSASAVASMPVVGASSSPSPTTNNKTIRVLFEDGLVKVMPIETYLRAIVPSEVPASWPTEAVKAQAVASRGYAQYAVEHPRHHPHADICTTTHCQYHDETKIAPQSDQAIQATSGIVIYADGKTINSLFSARCGGHTFNNEDVWKQGGPRPYLRGVPCPDSGKKYGHGVGMCQHGARVFAEQGKTYEQIITHFYQGTTVGLIKE